MVLPMMKFHGWQSLAAVVLLAGVLITEHGRAQVTPPTITSPLSLNAAAGQTVPYQITADNDPSSFAAVLMQPNARILLTQPDEDGLFEITLSSDYDAGDFFIKITATNAAGSDTEIIDVSVFEPGAAQILQTKIRVQPPRLNKATEQLVSTLSLRGVVRTEGQEREPSPGKIVRPLLTGRILSRTVLEEMAEMDLIPSKDGYALVMAGPLEGDLELFAMPRRGSDLEPVPVPTELISLPADDFRGVGSFSAQVRDDDVTRYRADFYQEITAQWMNYEGSTNRVELRGIAKGTSVLKFYRPPDEDERVPYYSISLSADLSGFNDGLPVLDSEAR
jgi:hypothetical protein